MLIEPFYSELFHWEWYLLEVVLSGTLAFVPRWWYRRKNANILIGAAILKSGHPTYGLRYRKPIIHAACVKRVHRLALNSCPCTNSRIEEYYQDKGCHAFWDCPGHSGTAGNYGIYRLSVHANRVMFVNVNYTCTLFWMFFRNVKTTEFFLSNL